MSAVPIYGPSHDPYNPEHRLLNMRERATVRNAHRFSFWEAAGKHHGACSCGHALAPAVHEHLLRPQADEHMAEVIEFARGMKVADAKARAADELERIDNAVESALWDGIAAQRRRNFGVL